MYSSVYIYICVYICKYVYVFSVHVNVDYLTYRKWLWRLVRLFVLCLTSRYPLPVCPTHADPAPIT